MATCKDMSCRERTEQDDSTLDESRWNALLCNFSRSGRLNRQWFETISAAYAEPHRHYHGTGHIAHCLQEFDVAKALFEHPREVELAIWFHDVVYDPKAADNEARSAARAVDMLTELEAPHSSIQMVEYFILSTRHLEQPPSPDARLLLDIDLSTLGQSRREYDFYESAIRSEYAWVPEGVYRNARRQILQGFIRRPRIFLSDFFFAKYESKARENIARALAAL